MKLINYIKSFKTFIPTWVICVCMFFWILGWPLIIALVLIVVQIKQKKRLFSSELADEGSLAYYENIVSIKNNEISELNKKLQCEKNNVSLIQKQFEEDKAFGRIQEESYQNKIQELRQKLAKYEFSKEQFILCAGKYRGGIDIPIGIYNLKVISGEGNFETNKPESIYENISCNSKDEFGYLNEYHNLEISDTTILKIRESAKIEFSLAHSYDFTEETRKQKEEFQREFDSKKQILEKELNIIKDELKILNNELIQKYYTFSAYDGISSQDCKNQLLLLKQKEQDLRKTGKDVGIQHHMNRSRKTEENITRQMLRTFNAECDNIMLNISSKNIDKARNMVQKSFDTINKLYLIDSASLTNALLKIKLEQITLMYTYELKYQQEKDIQKAIKEQMIEEAKAEREIQEQKKKIDKDLQQHLGEVNRLMKYLQKTQIEAEKQLYIDKIKELEDKIKMLESDKKAVLEREANAKAGFVYIISNIGSFGEGIYKIGMTRRLEPMDRIKELSSASVPFEFDVHAMIFSSDAPELENMLHKHFADNAVNKVNPRKEFFHVNIDDIEKIVKENYNDTVQFTKIPIATEYRQSLSIAQN